MNAAYLTPAITLFHEDGTLDFESQEHLFNNLIENGVDGILVEGSSSEFFAMPMDQRREMAKFAIETVNHRVKLIIGTIHMVADEIVNFSNFCLDAGADAVMILPPYYFHFGTEALLQYYDRLAAQIHGNIYIYNFPDNTGYTIPPQTVLALAKIHSNIVGMKDTSGDITQTSEFIRRTRDVEFKVFGGKDTLLYASLCHGAVGGVCTAANFMPELITDVYNKYADGDLAGSLEAQFKLNPVRLSMDAASFPVAAKDMANLRGRKVGVPYLPTLPTPEGAAKQGFVKTMTEAGLL